MKSVFSKIVLIAALLYGSVCVLMFFEQRRLMYVSKHTRVDAAHTNFSLQRGTVVLRGWQSHPNGAAVGGAGAPALIYLGGNAESVEATLPRLRQWLPSYSIYTLAYRGYGASDGSPAEADLEQDALALFDRVQQLHPQGQVLVLGRSLGTGVAAAVASQRQPAQVALITPFDDMLNTVRDHYGWLPVSWLLRDRYPAAEHLQRYEGPIFVLRAGQDTVVHPARTDALLQALKGRTGPAVQVVTFAQANHMDILDTPGIGPALRQWLGL